MAVADGSGIPTSVRMVSASAHEVTLIKENLDDSFAPSKPERLVGDRAYDSDPLDEALLAGAIEMSYERRAESYLGFVHLRYLVIMLRLFMR